MPYFRTDTLSFLKNTRQNNNREWFNENKSLYDEHIETPTKLFAEDISIALSKVTNEHISSKIFRFYRDLRFSKDKTPYNTYIRLAFYPVTDTVKKLCDAPNAFYLSLDEDKLMLGAGNMHFNPKQLSKFRHKLRQTSLAKNLGNLCQQYTQKNYLLSKPDLKKLPSGFERDQSYSEYSKHKGLTIFKSTEVNKNNIENIYNQTKAGCIDMLAFYGWFSDINCF